MALTRLRTRYKWIEDAAVVNNVKRESCSVEHLTLALQCGGSDGYQVFLLILH